MWRVNKTGKEQVWYEAEIIEKIKVECSSVLCFCDICENKEKCFACTLNTGVDMAKRILKLIQENEK